MSTAEYDYFTEQAGDALSYGRTTKAYSDIDISFSKNPLDNDITQKTGVASIKQALRTLVLLNHYEKPFHEDMGSDIYKSLFENFEPGIEDGLEYTIKRLIREYEKRVKVTDVKVTAGRDNNILNIQVEFKVLDSLEYATVNMFLQIDR